MNCLDTLKKISKDISQLKKNYNDKQKNKHLDTAPSSFKEFAFFMRLKMLMNILKNIMLFYITYDFYKHNLIENSDEFNLTVDDVILPKTLDELEKQLILIPSFVIDCGDSIYNIITIDTWCKILSINKIHDYLFFNVFEKEEHLEELTFLEDVIPLLDANISVMYKALLKKLIIACNEFKTSVVPCQVD